LGTLEDAADRVKQGDKSAFEHIVAETSVALVRLGARMLGNVSDAEDIVQETYLRAHRALVDGQFDGRSRVRTWLYRITSNLAIDALRSRKRQRVVSDDRAVGVSDGLAAAEARVALTELDDWLSVLPAEQRAALTLSVMEGFPNAEIARILGCSEGAVEQRLVRARTTLRSSIRSTDDD